MDRPNLIRRAVVAFLEYGLGAVVVLLDDPEPLYVRADEAVAQLSQWQVEPAIVELVARATGSYDPEQEAVVVREDAIGFTVSIERIEGGEIVGSVACAVVN
ncbi:MAG: hypothetical protein U0529_21265 [Thermoanaerobaculia bacterium]